MIFNVYIYVRWRSKILYPIRQVVIDENLTVMNTQVEVSCRYCCLAEGTIDIDEFDFNSVGITIKEISKKEFEAIWSLYTKSIKDEFLIEIKKYPIGIEIQGVGMYFYPQGMIFRVENIQGCAIGEYGINYPMGRIVKGKVIGYDFDNYWILIKHCTFD